MKEFPICGNCKHAGSCTCVPTRGYECRYYPPKDGGNYPHVLHITPACSKYEPREKE